MVDTHVAHQEQSLKRHLLIVGANMVDEEWRDFCDKRQKKIDKRNDNQSNAIMTVNEDILSVKGGGKGNEAV